MITIFINDQEHIVEKNLTIIQACEKVGIYIPRFCYHKKLAIVGSCRMCLVEVKKSPKLVASCSINITEGMNIYTESLIVRQARESVMEFLLINHPLDCPICDQGGECELQNQAFKYGRCKGRYNDVKRAVSDHNIGPLISTHMTRCIHCTRCIRFLNDIAGSYELGAIGRGEHMEISTHIAKSIQSEMSGNIIDLCPVGALTSKPYEFTARPWELKHTHSIDVMDAVGSHITVHTKNNQIMRVLPKSCDEINEEWISDRTRFAYDGLKYSRIDQPLIRNNLNTFIPVQYDDAINESIKMIKNSDKIQIICGQLSDIETMYAAKSFAKALNGYCDYEYNLHHLVSENRSDYIFNSTIAGIENANHCLLICTNPRYEASIINTRIRKAVMQNNMSVAVIGDKVNLNYHYNYLGSLDILSDILNNNHKYCKQLALYSHPIMICGSNLSINLMNILKNIAIKFRFIYENWYGFNILHFSAGAVGALDIGIVNFNKNLNQFSQSMKNTIILLGADDIQLSQNHQKIIYIGHHGDNNAQLADIIIPSPACLEKSGTYVNTEGRIQLANAVVKPLYDVHHEYQTILDLANQLNIELNFNNFDTLQHKIVQENSIFLNKNSTTLPTIDKKNYISNNVNDIQLSDVQYSFQYSVQNYYLTNAITRASRVMISCHKNNNIPFIRNN